MEWIIIGFFSLLALAFYLWWLGEQKRRAAVDTRHANDLKIVKDNNDAQANPFSGAKSANKWLRSKRDS